MINGIERIAITKLDVLDGFDEIRLCTGYELKGKRLKTFPTDCADARERDAGLRIYAGWKTPIADLRMYDDLPRNARRYLEALAHLTGTRALARLRRPAARPDHPQSPRCHERHRHQFQDLPARCATAIVAGMLLYSQQVTDQLLARERQVVDLYASSLEYITSETSATGDFSFVFDEVIRTIDFPVILTDANNNPIYWKNLDDSLTRPGRKGWHTSGRMIEEMDSQNTPIRIALNDTIVLNYVHYGESRLITNLRWLPVPGNRPRRGVHSSRLRRFQLHQAERTEQYLGGNGKGNCASARHTALQHHGMDGTGEHEANPALGETLAEMENDIERLNKVTARFSKIGSTPDLKQENLTEVIEGVIHYISKRLPKTGRKVELVIDTPGIFTRISTGNCSSG